MELIFWSGSPLEARQMCRIKVDPTDVPSGLENHFTMNF